MVGFSTLYGQLGIIVILFVLCVWAVVIISRYDMLDSEVSTFEDDVRHLTGIRRDKISRLSRKYDMDDIGVYDSRDMYAVDDANAAMNARQAALVDAHLLDDAELDGLIDVERDLKRASRFYNHVVKRYNAELAKTPSYVLSGDRVQKPCLRAFA